ncbi:MAG TPA: hypothetical protein VMS93_00135 [Candidatus Saccharimonadales bacterium]|nr:hypothetical protein [Candidatus Saccharimonadales bacterium]
MRWMWMAASLLVAAPALAAVPDPTFSIVDDVIALNPSGSCAFHVTVFNQFDAPINHSHVDVDFGTCPVSLSATQAPGFTVSGAVISGFTDPSGAVVFHIRGTGAGACTVRVIADGVIVGVLGQVNTCASTPARQTSWGRLRNIYH